MNRFLLLLGVAALVVAAPASAQYVFLDTNGDQACTSADALTSANTSVDVWYVTDHNKDGTTVTCPQDGSVPLTFNGYQFILHASGTGSVTFGAFTNAQATFTTQIGPKGQGGNTDYLIGFIGSTAGLDPGKYMAGTLAITVTGTPTLSIGTSTSLQAGAFTEYATNCSGGDADNTMKLGPNIGGSTDFTDACGTASPTPTKVTTWGAIKNLYR
jgi:hypothetical protein